MSLRTAVTSGEFCGVSKVTSLVAGGGQNTKEKGGAVSVCGGQAFSVITPVLQRNE